MQRSLVNRICYVIWKYATGQTGDDFVNVSLVCYPKDVVVDLHVDSKEV